MRHGKFKENLKKVHEKLQQFPGKKAAWLAKSSSMSRSAVYDYLNVLVEQGKASNINGLWYPEEHSESSKISIVQLVIGHSALLISKDTSLTLEALIRNQTTTAITVEKISLSDDHSIKCEASMQVDIPAGLSRIVSFSTLSNRLGEIWDQGGKIQIQIATTLGSFSSEFSIPGLVREYLPVTFFPEVVF